MYSMNPLPVRVLPGTLPGGFPSTAPRRGDYEALVRLARRGPSRARAWREPGAAPRAGEQAGYPAAGQTHADESRDASDQAAGHALERPIAVRERVRTPITPQPMLACASTPAPPTAERRVPIDRRLQAFAAPCVSAIAELRQEFDGWVRFLVEHAADFCCDRAVSGQGQWAVRLTLDSAILPDCALHLNLSHFTLALRFETQTDVSRQLVLHHEQTLKTQLAAVLAERGEPREIEIAID